MPHLEDFAWLSSTRGLARFGISCSGPRRLLQARSSPDAGISKRGLMVSLDPGQQKPEHQVRDEFESNLETGRRMMTE
jgi:hypothetical protein